MFDINTVILEGPDLSGKTTLYNSLHKESNYRWNIQDRSTLSMVCFARQFNRPVNKLRSALLKEVSNLNNVIVVLMPKWQTLEERFHKRGDEIQTLSSLSTLYDIFTEEVSKIQALPNVLIIKESYGDLAKDMVSNLKLLEQKEMVDVGCYISQFVTYFEKNEVKLDMCFSGKIQDISDEILLDPLEGDYYKDILWDFDNTIRKELKGLNPYNVPQTMSSRRFYYSTDSCISSIHFMPRNDTLKCYVVFRSTNAIKNAGIDLSFINFLVHRLGNKYFSTCKIYELDVRMNSAHIVDAD